MKIVHVLPLLIKGGAERVAADLAIQAALAGHEVTLIAAYPVDSTYLRDSLHPEIQVLYVLGMAVSKTKMYLGILPWICRHRGWLAEQNIIHCHLTYGTVFGAVLCFLRPFFGSSRPAVVETYHSVGMAVPALLRWVHAKMAANFDAFALMAEDNYWSAFIKRRPRLPSALIPNGISFKGLVNADHTICLDYRRQLKIPDECRYVIGTVGKLRRDRKPWLYLQIFAQIIKVFGSEVHFLIAGDGSEYTRMRSLITKYGLDKQVHLPGFVIEPSLPISTMDLYITLNVGAVTGIAALEAAYLGIPVLAIQVSPNYKAKPQDWIWSSANLSEVAGKAIELIGSQSDRQALARKQAAYVRSHHAVESMKRSYDALYRAAIERAGFK